MQTHSHTDTQCFHFCPDFVFLSRCRFFVPHVCFFVFVPFFFFCTECLFFCPGCRFSFCPDGRLFILSRYRVAGQQRKPHHQLWLPTCEECRLRAVQSPTIHCIGNSHVEVTDEDVRCHTSARFFFQTGNEKESQSQSGQTHTLATAPQNNEGGKWRQAVMTAEVQGTTPSEPTGAAVQQGKSERAALAHAKREAQQ